MFGKLALTSILTLGLSGCIVSRILGTGDSPRSTTPVTPLPVSISIQEGLGAIGLNMITVSREMGRVTALFKDIATQIQAIQSHVFFNVKGSGLSNWDFANGVYTLSTSEQGTTVTLKFMDAQGRLPEWDVLNPTNYGDPPKRAKTFPTELTRFQVSVEKKNVLKEGGKLQATLTGVPPRQMPLTGSFTVPFQGNGTIDGHPKFTQLTFNINGNASQDGSLLNGSLSFESLFNLQTYNGVGSFNQSGFTSPVPIQKNGVAVGEITPNGKQWNVLINGQVIATGG